MLDYTSLSLIKENNNCNKIIYVCINEYEFVFRLLGYKEFEDLKHICFNEKTLQDAVCNLTVLYPENFTFNEYCIAGITDICSKAIIQNSKVNDINAIMDTIYYYREQMNRNDNVCINMIKSAFPEYRIEEILDWNWDKIIEYSVRAEQILNMRLNGCKLVDNRTLKDEDTDDNKMTKDEFNNELIKQGISPTLYYNNDTAKSLVEKPFITGIKWRR